MTARGAERDVAARPSATRGLLRGTLAQVSLHFGSGNVDGTILAGSPRKLAAKDEPVHVATRKAEAASSLGNGQLRISSGHRIHVTHPRRGRRPARRRGRATASS